MTCGIGYLFAVSPDGIKGMQKYSILESLIPRSLILESRIPDLHPVQSGDQIRGFGDSRIRGFGIRDSGCGIRDTGYEDEGSGMRDTRMRDRG
jgi:hypothetical protein